MKKFRAIQIVKATTTISNFSVPRIDAIFSMMSKEGRALEKKLSAPRRIEIESDDACKKCRRIAAIIIKIGMNENKKPNAQEAAQVVRLFSMKKTAVKNDDCKITRGEKSRKLRVFFFSVVFIICFVIFDMLCISDYRLLKRVRNELLNCRFVHRWLVRQEQHYQN